MEACKHGQPTSAAGESTACNCNTTPARGAKNDAIIRPPQTARSTDEFNLFPAPHSLTHSRDAYGYFRAVVGSEGTNHTAVGCHELALECACTTLLTRVMKACHHHHTPDIYIRGSQPMETQVGWVHALWGVRLLLFPPAVTRSQSTAAAARNYYNIRSRGKGRRAAAHRGGDADAILLQQRWRQRSGVWALAN